MQQRDAILSQQHATAELAQVYPAPTRSPVHGVHGLGAPQGTRVAVDSRDLIEIIKAPTTTPSMSLVQMKHSALLIPSELEDEKCPLANATHRSSFCQGFGATGPCTNFTTKEQPALDTLQQPASIQIQRIHPQLDLR